MGGIASDWQLRGVRVVVKAVFGVDERGLGLTSSRGM
jgi:hypothetical protein